MRTVVAVGVAGSVGAMARYWVEGLIARRVASFPWGTLVVNLGGSFLIGLLFATFLEGRLIMVPWLRAALTVGLIGGFTTFSTLTLETFRLLEDGSYLLAAANALGSLALGLVAVYVGVVVGRSI
jgi:CrcB protein